MSAPLHTSNRTKTIRRRFFSLALALLESFMAHLFVSRSALSTEPRFGCNRSGFLFLPFTDRESTISNWSAIGMNVAYRQKRNVTEAVADEATIKKTSVKE